MKKLYLFACINLLIFTVTNLFAATDSLNYVKDYTWTFEESSQNSQWKFKHSSGKNKWIIKSPDGENTCLYVSQNAEDTTYNDGSASISVAYIKVLLPSEDSLVIEFDANVGGEGAKDYMKVLVVPDDFEIDIPKPNSTNLKFAGAYNKDSSFVFDDGKVYLSGTKGQKHIVAKMKNVLPCGAAKLMFVWRNDNVDGNDPSAIIDNIQFGGEIIQINKTICKGDYFTINNQSVNQSGYYYDTLQTQQGCDSIICYNLTIKDTYMLTKNIEICSGETYVLNNGTEVSNSGTYKDYFQTVDGGCDSIVTINLLVKPKDNITIYDTICSGAVYTKYGFNLTSSGLYSDTLQKENGCDSIINIMLTVNNTYNITHADTICTGEVYTNYGFNENNPGFYTHQYQTIDGCDSIVNLNLKINDTLLVNIYDSICYGQIYSGYNFNELSESGIYIDSLQSVNGCDSIVTLHLTVLPVNTSNNPDTAEICQGESIEFVGKTLVSSGFYEETLKNIYGCDSVVSLNLTVNAVYWTVDSVTLTQGQTFTFNGKTYSEGGTYVDTLKSVNGCDSIVTLNITKTSSLSEIIDLQSIKMFPNPIKDFLTIELQYPANKTIISVFNQLGEKVKNAQMSAKQNKIVLYLGDLQKGPYVIEFVIDDITIRKNIILQ